ncbi:MAG: putative colanic acid biosynthesis acetyltransferase [Planctomycetota bacterium]|nr:putative colanic acid biosynthesis acetyltransferase [Planctomycetota bacterium]
MSARQSHLPPEQQPASALGSEALTPEQDSPHSLANRAGRALWGVAYALLFRPSPRPLHRWRNLLLRAFGARLHPTARVYPRARVWSPANLVMDAHSCLADDVDCYNVRTITIGMNSTVSQYSYLCGATHDFEKPEHPLVPLAITIGKNVWVAADVFVAPGVTIADGVVVGARSSVFKDLPAWTVCVGSPAKPVRPREIRS